jgi:hypothetical protein
VDTVTRTTAYAGHVDTSQSHYGLRWPRGQESLTLQLRLATWTRVTRTTAYAGLVDTSHSHYGLRWPRGHESLALRLMLAVSVKCYAAVRYFDQTSGAVVRYFCCSLVKGSSFSAFFSFLVVQLVT